MAVSELYKKQLINAFNWQSSSMNGRVEYRVLDHPYSGPVLGLKDAFVGVSAIFSSGH